MARVTSLYSVCPAHQRHRHLVRGPVPSTQYVRTLSSHYVPHVPHPLLLKTSESPLAYESAFLGVGGGGGGVLGF